MTRYSSPPDSFAYRNRVWQIVKQIPPGHVATYGQIAALIPVPAGVEGQHYLAFGARWVGSAMANCPDDVPWQRVVNSQGKVSLAETAGGQLQRELLEAEGINFDERNRIDLKRYRWAGPEKEGIN